MQAEGDFGWGKYYDLRFTKRPTYLQDWFSKASQGSFFVGTVDEPREHVSTIRGVDLAQRIVALVEFVQVPLGGFLIQMSDALACECGTAARNEQLQTFDREVCGMSPTTDIEPDNAEGESCVNRDL
jgi:hypothetical protein